MSNFHEIADTVFHDWNYSTPKALYGLVRALKPSVVVDCGTYRGYSAAWMAQAVKENAAGMVYAIDDFSLKQFTPDRNVAVAHFWDNLDRCGVREYVTLIEGKSEEVKWPERVDFAYIDGWHSYLAAKHDFEQAAKRGAECICLDDVTQSVGPRMLMDDPKIREEWDIVFVNRDCGMAICMRKTQRGPITFSQEIPGHLGHDLQVMTRAEQLEHLREASKINGVGYAHITHLLHEGKT